MILSRVNIKAFRESCHLGPPVKDEKKKRKRWPLYLRYEGRDHLLGYIQERAKGSGKVYTGHVLRRDGTEEQCALSLFGGQAGIQKCAENIISYVILDIEEKREKTPLLYKPDGSVLL